MTTFVKLTPSNNPYGNGPSIKRTAPITPPRSLKRQKLAEQPPATPAGPPTADETPEELEALRVRTAPLTDFDKVRELAASTEGTIHLAKYKPSGKLFVFKTTNPPPPQYRKAFKTKMKGFPPEVDALMKLGAAYEHPNVIQIVFARTISNLRCVICLDYCSGGDVWDQMHRFKAHGVRETPVLFVLQVIIGMTEALAYIHNGLIYDETSTDVARYRQVCEPPKLTHLDIKAENIFLKLPVDEHGLPTIVLADFGQAALKPTYPCGTPGHNSPEQLRPALYEPTSTKTDIYSFGLSVFEICNWQDNLVWRTGRDPGKIVLPKHFANTGVDRFLTHCLTVNPRDRFAMVEGQGLGYARIFRKMRERAARKSKIDAKFWADPAGAEAATEADPQLGGREKPISVDSGDDASADEEDTEEYEDESYEEDEESSETDDDDEDYVDQGAVQIFE